MTLIRESGDKSVYGVGREIVLDTETTGFKPAQGHRMVEIGCVELNNCVPTGKEFHVYMDPQRDVPQPAYAVHGLSWDFLKKHKPFVEIAKSLTDFLENSPLIIHNAAFDMRFLQFELELGGFNTLSNPVVDTLEMVRKKFPGSPASLDMLCKRFKIDNSNRLKHGALLDAQLLSEVYLELLGGSQAAFLFDDFSHHSADATVAIAKKKVVEKEVRAVRTFALTAEEQKAHEKLLSELKKS